MHAPETTPTIISDAPERHIYTYGARPDSFPCPFQKHSVIMAHQIRAVTQWSGQRHDDPRGERAVGAEAQQRIVVAETWLPGFLQCWRLLLWVRWP
jgi:hypothetical protein